MTDQINELSNSTLQSVAKKRADQSKEAGGIGVNNPTRAKAMDLLRKSDNAKYRHTEHPSKVTPKVAPPAPTEADKAAHAKANKAKVDSQNNRGYGEGRYMGDSVEQTEVEDQLDEAGLPTIPYGDGHGGRSDFSYLSRQRNTGDKPASKDLIAYHKGEIERLVAKNGYKSHIKYHERHIRILMKEEVESIEEAHKLGDKVEVVKGDGKGTKGTIGEIRHGLFKGAPKNYTVYHGEHGAIQVPKEHIRKCSEEVESLDEDQPTYKMELDNGDKVKHPMHGLGKVIGKLSTGTLKIQYNKYAEPLMHKRAEVKHIKEEVESVTELSMDTVKSYKEKVTKNPAPSKTTSNILHKAIRRFAGKERAEDRIHSDEMKKMRERLGLKNEEVLDEGSGIGIGDLVKFHKIAGMNGHRYAQIHGLVTSKKDGRIDPMTGRVHGTVTHFVAKLKKDPLNTVNWNPDVHIPVDDVHKVDQHDEIQNHLMRARMLAKIKGESVETLDEEVTFSGKGANGVKYEIIKTGDDHAIHANGKHIDTYGSHQRALSVLKNEVPGLKANLKEETLDEDAAQKNMTNAMDNIDPVKRDAARKQYKAARDTGMNHASSISLMHQRFGKTNEEVDEAVKTEKPQHKVGDTVWAASPTNKALTMTGKVTKIGQTLTTVKHKDGTEAHYPHKFVNNDYEVLHPNPKKWQREHLELTGELLSLTEVKYILENANGGVGAIAQHAGVDGAGPQGTGKVKKMMGNKTDAAAIAKIIVNGAKSKEERN